MILILTCPICGSPILAIGTEEKPVAWHEKVECMALAEPETEPEEAEAA